MGELGRLNKNKGPEAEGNTIIVLLTKSGMNWFKKSRTLTIQT